jgi:uncharacterized protein
MLLWEDPIKFEWDMGNIAKTKKHGLSQEEIESVFFDPNKKVYFDQNHSELETRYLIVGLSQLGRHTYLVVTERKGKVRIISARYMHQKEVKLYEK